MTAPTRRPSPAPAEPIEPAEPLLLRRTLLSVIAVALLALAGVAGWLIRGGGSTGVATPTTSSVDAGFTRDMSTHHLQAVTMAGYERDNTTNPGLKVLATDIETSQNFQIGEMQGWLDSWNLSRNSTNEMAWMRRGMGQGMGQGMGHGMGLGPTALMPGMATPAQMDRLESSHGTALDILFLQLMIRHHQGGLPMAQYALKHADEPYVRDLAQSIVNSQTAEIVEMKQMLHQLGGTPLPPPVYGG